MPVKTCNPHTEPLRLISYCLHMIRTEMVTFTIYSDYKIHGPQFGMSQTQKMKIITNNYY